MVKKDKIEHFVQLGQRKNGRYSKNESYEVDAFADQLTHNSLAQDMQTAAAKHYKSLAVPSFFDKVFKSDVYKKHTEAKRTLKNAIVHALKESQRKANIIGNILFLISIDNDKKEKKKIAAKKRKTKK